MQDMQKKASKSTHSVRDEWGVTAAAQVDRARARAEGQYLSALALAIIPLSMLANVCHGDLARAVCRSQIATRGVPVIPMISYCILPIRTAHSTQRSRYPLGSYVRTFTNLQCNVVFVSDDNHRL